MNSTKMDSSYVDGKSFIGSILSFIFAFIGVASLQEWAYIISIIAGVFAIARSAYLLWRDIKNDRRKY